MNNRSLLLSLVPLTAFLSFSSQAQTPLGNVVSDQTLTLANSPYVAGGSISVASGATLTIEAGVNLQLGPSVSLRIENGGRLLVNGAAEAPVRFTAVPGSGRWGGLTIRGSANSPESVLEHLEIRGNGSTAIHLDAGTAVMRFLRFYETDHQYISLDGSSFEVSDCYFPSGTTGFELMHGTQGVKPGGRGIVRHCFFGRTMGYNDVIDFTGGNRPGQPLFQVFNNVFIGSSDDILDLDGTDAWVQGNIFLHTHRNGSPDSASAVSGGDSGSDTSEITIINNLFYDCDQAATAKEGDFFVLVNNTILHTTRAGGVDSASGVINVRDLDPSPTRFGRGFYLESNVIWDAEQLVRNYVEASVSVTFTNNILPSAWAGLGGANRVIDPQFVHTPDLPETVFTSWEEAQVFWDWLALAPESPAAGLGAVRGGGGVAISGEPDGSTSQTGAELFLSGNFSAPVIPASGWPLGAGYTHYRWRLDDGPWSEEIPLNQPIVLEGLAPGVHTVFAAGKNDAGFYQNDPALGEDGMLSQSKPWTATGSSPSFAAFTFDGSLLHFQVMVPSGQAAVIESAPSVPNSTWIEERTIQPGELQNGVASFDLPIPADNRFFRLRAN